MEGPTAQILAPWTRNRMMLAVAVFVVGSLLWFSLGPFAALEDQAPGGILDDDRGFTADQAAARFDAMGADGRDLYQAFLGFDFIYAILFVVAGVAVWARMTRVFDLAGKAAPFVWFIVAGGLLDWIENLLLLSMLSMYPEVSGVVGVASTISILKLLAVSIAMIVLAVGLLSLLVHSIIHPMQPKRMAR